VTDLDIRSHPDAPEIERWTPPARRLSIRVHVSVDNNHCHRYAVCQQEAPHVFQLTPDGRLTYDPSPDPRHLEAVRQAARVCPMQAIEIEERSP
jgi:ferredoxin